MKSNLSDIDRIARAALSAAFILLYFTHIVTGTLGIIPLVLAAFFLFTYSDNSLLPAVSAVQIQYV
jgi:hypothetical protein